MGRITKRNNSCGWKLYHTGKIHRRLLIIFFGRRLNFVYLKMTITEEIISKEVQKLNNHSLTYENMTLKNLSGHIVSERKLLSLGWNI